MEIPLELVSVMIALFSALISLLGFLYEHFKVIMDLRERLASLETKVSLFWTYVEKTIPQMLKHPNDGRKDHLLDKMIQGLMNLTEATELKKILECEVQEKPKDKDTLAKILVIARIEQILFEMRKGLEGKKLS